MAPHADVRLLLAEPNARLTESIHDAFRSDAFDFVTVDSQEKAYNAIEEHSPDVLIAALKTPLIDGLDLLAIAQRRRTGACVILLADASEIELGTEAMRQGAYDFLVRPINVGRLVEIVRRGLDYQRLAADQGQLQRRLDERFGIHQFIGTSHAMLNAYDRVKQAAASESPVVVAGEPGTGKDLVAHLVHFNSDRARRPFVKAPAYGLSESALARGLFGHAAGAFEGAGKARAGLLESADGGTIYLDDAQCITGAVGEQLIGVLSDGHVTRLGDDHAVATRVRFVASIDPAQEVSPGAGRFLSLLRDRFDPITIDLPPLRERTGDIPAFAERFRATATFSGDNPAEISGDVLELFLRYSWPGNVGELQNTVELMLARAKDRPHVTISDVPRAIRDAARAPSDIHLPIGVSIAQAERILIEETLKAADYDKRLCARTLGIGLRTLYRKLRQYEAGDTP